MKDKNRKREIGFDSGLIGVFIGGMAGTFFAAIPGDIILKVTLLFFSVGFTMGKQIITFRDRKKIREIERLLKEALS